METVKSADGTVIAYDRAQPDSADQAGRCIYGWLFVPDDLHNAPAPGVGDDGVTETLPQGAPARARATPGSGPWSAVHRMSIPGRRNEAREKAAARNKTSARPARRP